MKQAQTMISGKSAPEQLQVLENMAKTAGIDTNEKWITREMLQQFGINIP